MLSPDASENALRSFFRKHTIAEISELFRLLETRSRMSVFRRLKAMGYRSSFTHAGRYYTLTNVPRFDQWGLWFHRNVGFSCAGTLKDTVVELVESSATGMTPKELLAVLKLPVANTLYNTLHELRQGARIRRQDLAGFHLYLSANLGRADEQLLKRRQELSQEVPAENFFGEFKHDERRRSGRKNLTQDLEQLPAEAVLVYNLEHADYVALVCGSLDRLAEAFAHLDFDQHEKRLRGLPSGDRQQDLRSEIQLASASLSTADRRVIRTEEMDRRIAAAARSRAPYHRH